MSVSTIVAQFNMISIQTKEAGLHDIGYCTTLYYLIMLSMFWRVQFHDIMWYHMSSCHDMISRMWCHAMISGMWCHAMISRVNVMTWYRVCDVMPCYRVYWRVQFHDIYKLNSISCDIICRCSSCHAMISYVMWCHVMISSIHEPRVVLSISNNNVIAYNA